MKIHSTGACSIHWVRRSAGEGMFPLQCSGLQQRLAGESACNRGLSSVLGLEDPERGRATLHWLECSDWERFHGLYSPRVYKSGLWWAFYSAFSSLTLVALGMQDTEIRRRRKRESGKSWGGRKKREKKEEEKFIELKHIIVLPMCA